MEVTCHLFCQIEKDSGVIYFSFVISAEKVPAHVQNQDEDEDEDEDQDQDQDQDQDDHRES